MYSSIYWLVNGCKIVIKHFGKSQFLKYTLNVKHFKNNWIGA